MEDITGLLRRWRDGDRQAESILFAAVSPNLKRLANHFMKAERKGHSLQPTELVDEIYFKLVAAKDRDWRNRGHFFAIAARAMRRYLIDHARGKKKGRVTLSGLDEILPAPTQDIDTALMVDTLLDELNKDHPDWVQVVEVKYFLGLTDDAAADALGIKLRTLQHMWSHARQWLFERMEGACAQRKAAR